MISSSKTVVNLFLWLARLEVQYKCEDTCTSVRAVSPALSRGQSTPFTVTGVFQLRLIFYFSYSIFVQKALWLVLLFTFAIWGWMIEQLAQMKLTFCVFHVKLDMNFFSRLKNLLGSWGKLGEFTPEFLNSLSLKNLKD